MLANQGKFRQIQLGENRRKLNLISSSTTRVTLAYAFCAICGQPTASDLPTYGYVTQTSRGLQVMGART